MFSEQYLKIFKYGVFCRRSLFAMIISKYPHPARELNESPTPGLGPH
jgi:hypothetical protein